jgi:hypothetical protein
VEQTRRACTYIHTHVCDVCVYDYIHTHVCDVCVYVRVRARGTDATSLTDMIRRVTGREDYQFGDLSKDALKTLTGTAVVVRLVQL